MTGEPLLKIYKNNKYSFEPIGRCEAMQEIFRCIDKVASTAVSILILGERGSGKKFLGRTIHRKSAFRDGPFLIATEASLGEILGQSEKKATETESGAPRAVYPDNRGTIPVTGRYILTKSVR